MSGEHVVQSALASDQPIEPDLVVAVGKAASGMCLGAIKSVSKFGEAIVVTKYNHTDVRLYEHGNVRVIESGHPVPDENSLIAGNALLQAISGLHENAQLLLLVSGGASALAEVLPDGVALEAWQAKTEELIASGIPIDVINTERKKVSLIKNGKLLKSFTGQEARIYAISDVEGDDIRVIGSGLGFAERPTYEYSSRIIGSNAIARSAAADAVHSAGLNVQCNEETLYDDVFALAPRITDALINGKPGVYIWGGEPTIRLPDKPGNGGRNQSLALAIAVGIAGQENIVVLVAGTDGTDGPTQAAGAIVNGNTCDDREAARNLLMAADAGSYLGKRDSLFMTGTTNTNVMDLAIAIVQ